MAYDERWLAVLLDLADFLSSDGTEKARVVF